MKPRPEKNRICSVNAGRNQGPWSTSNRSAWWFVFILGFFLTSAWSDVFHLDSVRIEAPRILKDSLIYTMDVHFLERPGSFWSYYDPGTGSIIIEFLDAQIQSSEVNLPKGLPFLEFRVRRMESQMALTKEVSRVYVTIDRGEHGEQVWNNDVRLVNNSMVRIVIWKEMAPSHKSIAKKSRTIAITVGTFVLVIFGVVAFFTL
jgi:hypothetical protein